MKYERGKIYEIRVKISILDGGIFILSPMWGQSPEYVRTEFRPYVFLGGEWTRRPFLPAA